MNEGQDQRRVFGLASTLRRAMSLTSIWSIIAGFYLVAYVFWVPHLFTQWFLVTPIAAVTLAVGLALLRLGFREAMRLQSGEAPVAIRSERPLWFAGGIALLCYASVYVPASSRVVAHWPLDLAVTIAAGVTIISYAVIGHKGG